MGKVIGAEKCREMEKYINKRFCLAEDEQILYECKGNIKQEESFNQKGISEVLFRKRVEPVKISVLDGDLVFTNYRIIAHGLLKAGGGYSESFLGSEFFGSPIRSKRAKKKTKKALIESFPVFGYQFPIKNHTGLHKSKRLGVVYSVNIDKKRWITSIKPNDRSKRDEHLNQIFEILRKDANEVLDFINQVYEIEKSETKKRRAIVSILKALRKSEEFTHLSDSEFFDIVRETFKLNPEFFMTSVYPKMMSWKFPSLWLKEQIKLLIDPLWQAVLDKPEQE